jgi:hypothetical protein
MISGSMMSRISCVIIELEPLIVLKLSGKKVFLILVRGAKLSLYRLRNKGKLLTSTDITRQRGQEGRR